MGLEVLATIAAVTAVASAGSALIGGAAEREQAGQDEAVRQSNNRQTRLDTAKQYEALSKREVVASKQTTVNSLQARREIMQAQASAANQAGSSGTFGGSIDAQLMDLQATGGRNLEAIKLNHETMQDELTLAAENIQRTGTARIDNTIINMPSWGGILTGVAVGGLSSASSVVATGG